MFLGFIHKQEPGFYCISWIPHLSYKVCSRQIFVMLSVNIVFSLSCPQAEKKDHKKRCRRKAGMRRDNRGFGQEKGGLWLAHAFFYSFFSLSQLNKHQVWRSHWHVSISQRNHKKKLFYKRGLLSSANKNFMISLLCRVFWFSSFYFFWSGSSLFTRSKRLFRKEKKERKNEKGTCLSERWCLLGHKLNSSFLAEFGWGMTDVYTDSSCPNMNAARQGLAVSPRVP